MFAFRQPEHAIPGEDTSQRDRRLALGAILVNVGLVNLDYSMSSAALPTIAQSLGVTDAETIWVIGAYQIAMVAMLLPMTSLGEIIGLRRIMMAGLVLLVVAPLCAFFSPSLPWLVAARALQGTAAACVLGLSLAMMRTVASDGRLGSAMGMNALIVGVSIAAGPILAGAMLSIASWHWMFLVIVALGVVAVETSRRYLLPTLRGSWRYDAVAAALAALMLGATVYGLNTAAHGGALVETVLGLGIGGVALLVLLRRQAGNPAPLLAFDLLKEPAFALPVLLVFCASATQSLAFVSLPFLLQRELGFSQVEMGFLIMPWPIISALIAPVAGQLSDRLPTTLLSGAGLAIVGAGIGLLLIAPAPSLADAAWRLAICGVGFGLFKSPNMRAMMIAGPVERIGRAGGISSMMNNLGSATGAALVAGLFAFYGDRGAETALWAAAGLCVFSAVLTLVRWPRSTAAA